MSIDLPAPAQARPADEAAYAREMITRICAEIGPRRATTPAERLAHEWVRREYERLGDDLRVEFEAFDFNRNLYATLALHFGAALVGTAVGRQRPIAGGLLTSAAALSYWADSTRRAELIRRLMPYHESQNLLATLPADGRPELRIVLISHVDAAFTGLLFDPRFTKLFAHKGRRAPYLARSLAVATHATLAGGLLATIRGVARSGSVPLRRAEEALSIPALLTFLLNLDVTARNTTVPGAADNLSGVAALLLLAHRIRQRRDPRVEYVFVTTGAEEAGTGGARRLAASRRDAWDTSDTVIIAVDTITNGDLCWLDEGEVDSQPTPPWLASVLSEVTLTDDRFAGIGPYRIPVGATDALPFHYAGYDATGITAVDPSIGTPRHYHHPTDTPENVDWEQFAVGVDFVDAAVAAVIAERLG